MEVQTLLPQPTIAEIFFQIWHYGQITRQHRLQLRSILLEMTLTEEELTAINRLIHAVRRGWLQLVD